MTFENRICVKFKNLSKEISEMRFYKNVLKILKTDEQSDQSTCKIFKPKACAEL